MPGYIHHIEWCVRDLDSLSRKLSDCYGFSLTHQRHLTTDEGGRVASVVRQNVLQSGHTVFVLSQNTATDPEQLRRVSDDCDGKVSKNRET